MFLTFKNGSCSVTINSDQISSIEFFGETKRIKINLAGMRPLKLSGPAAESFWGVWCAALGLNQSGATGFAIDKVIA